MKDMLFKDTLREIRRSLSRFLSIFFIVAIGVSFFAGVKATCPDMQDTADEYFDQYNLYDIQVFSTYGIDENDLETVRNIQGIENVKGACSVDTLAFIGKDEAVLKVMSMTAQGPDREDVINQFKLIEGRLPEKPGECLGEKGKILDSSMEIGETITLSSGTDAPLSDSLKYNEYTVVGIVETPYYISFERGTTSIGSGNIDYFIMVPEEDFNLPHYTEMYVTVQNAKSLGAYTDEYDALIKKATEKIEPVGEERRKERYDEVIDEARRDLQEQKDKLQEAKDAQKKEIEKAQNELHSAEQSIKDGEKELDYKRQQLKKTQAESQARIDEGYEQLSAAEEEYNQKLKEYNEEAEKAAPELDKAESQLKDMEDKILELEGTIQAFQLQLKDDSLTAQEKEAIEAKLLELETTLSALRTAYEQGANEYESKKAAFDEASIQITIARVKLDVAREDLEMQQSQLDASIAEANDKLRQAEKKLLESKAQLKEGYAELEKKKAESDQEIADGEKKIEDAENKISDLQEPAWYILDRKSNYGAVEFGYTADRMDAIGKVFPVFFFFVAALVCLTTMTRMVDEQRGYIGTLKALGYSKGRITFKYLMYAVSASVLGSVLGFSIGFRLFPSVIFSAYSIMYILPPIKTPFNLKYAVLSTAIATATTTLAAWAACYSELADTPASLMRPRAPKPGKRIFLERITFLWRRLSFTRKITARNLFRYKKRLYMTVFGIAGCTALLLTGFGLKDSIISIVSKQFDELYQYQAIVDLKKGIKVHEPSSITSQLNGDDRIKGYMLMMNQNVELVEGDTVKGAILSVPEDTGKMIDYILFRNRRTKKEVPLTDDGAVLTEKLADQLGVKAGDTVYIKDGDTDRLQVKVTGIIENYVQHYIYLSPSTYTRLYNKEPEYTRIVAKTSQTSSEFEKQLSEDIMANNEVQAISLTTGLTESFEETISSLNYVVIVLIVSAAALAFVVMYNLTNINITERIREIASLKVLGFHDREVSEYVFRENIFLTIFGIVFGLVFGIFLHRFTVTTAEVNYVMFGREIKPISYVYSAALTVVFSGFVSVVMHFRLKTIGMVESMKSVD